MTTMSVPYAAQLAQANPWLVKVSLDAYLAALTPTYSTATGIIRDKGKRDRMGEDLQFRAMAQALAASVLPSSGFGPNTVNAAEFLRLLAIDLGLVTTDLPHKPTGLLPDVHDVEGVLAGFRG